MPELPEVENVRRGLEAAFLGKKLSVLFVRRTELRWPIPVAELEAALGEPLLSVKRRSKYLCLDLGGKTSFLIHLGMSGQLLELGTRPAEPWDTHEHWRMRFGRHWLGYVDPRRFGMLLACPKNELPRHRLLVGLGPDADSELLDASELHAASRGRKVRLKSFLMDARNVAGIGNIYASEICFDAGLRPGKAVGRVSLVAFERIVRSTRRIMLRAISSGGTTLRDYRMTGGQVGAYQQELLVYAREGLPCRSCQSLIRMQSIQSRSSFYCPACQK